MKRAAEASEGVLAGIGSTPLVELRKVVPQGSARVLAKLEFANPTGSMKDRMAVAAVEAAETRGDISPGDTVVEYTAGTTGISLALACAAKGYGLHVVFSDAFSDEKRRTMEALGATVEDVPSDRGRITESLIKAMIVRAGELSAKPGHWACDQLNNRDAITGYLALGEEIWQQSNGRVDAFVQSVGTAHSIHGAARALRRHLPALRVVAVEPAESSVLSGGPTGSHRIEGIGIGFTPPLWEPEEVDAIEVVSSEDAMAMSRRLAREEGIFAGTSSGGNVVAALRVAEQLGPDATVATIMVDSGFRYLSTGLYG
ncbi:PLP-dependent cysteine synthase family protein [Pseudarthrobacter sp. NamE5]|uniref:PLP-dependent cysteine synthase family protein n=1 Tax=Pseudarthrobacter sp. NamE5 TaxID=2576839 RepID=UPI00110B5C1E|nr:cysteine synthase family protein [Pseudarthrobacter sp. NamE5]TLM85786.1 cysteine synthase family protein [Pseudarthrobacter sp. NamE5]